MIAESKTRTEGVTWNTVLVNTLIVDNTSQKGDKENMDSQKDCSQPGNSSRSFAALVSDWYWRLDENLCYVFHDGTRSPLHAADHQALTGVNRIEHLSRSCQPNQESNLATVADETLITHFRLLEEHKPIDETVLLCGDSGERLYAHIVAQPIVDSSGVFQGYRGCGRDVTEQVTMQSQLTHLANHDDLTGLYNRREFYKRLEELQNFVEGTLYEFSLCLLDLDRFKLVNDTAGHAAGDKLLIELSHLMSSFLGEGEMLARMGGDEFAILLELPVLQAEVRGREIIEAISNHKFEWDGRGYSVGACIGITPVVHGVESIGVLTDRADSACYAAKNSGRNQCVVFSHDSKAYLAYRTELAQLESVKEALQANRLRLFMQAIEPCSANAGNCAHYEILLRLQSESGELLPPSTFIPVAERFNIMQDLDKWVLEHCLDVLKTYRKVGQEVSLSINLSGNTLSDQSALDYIVETVCQSSVPASLLCFEITETAAISNIENVVCFMNDLKAAGARFALDDFGAGLSSFAYIRSLPIDFLKIDGYFIRNIRSDATNRAITAAFLQLSKQLGIATVAEFVEDKATRKLVEDMGIDYVQGYGVARPVDVEYALANLLPDTVSRAA